MMFARRNIRDVVEKAWKQISYLQLKEFVSDKKEDLFVWLVKDGVNKGRFHNATQSWGEIVKSANDSSGIQPLLLENKELWHFLILVYPHRANNDIIKMLDEV